MRKFREALAQSLRLIGVGNRVPGPYPVPDPLF